MYNLQFFYDIHLANGSLCLENIDIHIDFLSNTWLKIGSFTFFAVLSTFISFWDIIRYEVDILNK